MKNIMAWVLTLVGAVGFTSFMILSVGGLLGLRLHVVDWSDEIVMAIGIIWLVISSIVLAIGIAFLPPIVKSRDIVI